MQNEGLPPQLEKKPRSVKDKRYEEQTTKPCWTMPPNIIFRSVKMNDLDFSQKISQRFFGKRSGKSKIAAAKGKGAAGAKTLSRRTRRKRDGKRT